ncbi:outer membrane beta-barrel protein [Tenacibaculum halocynthiae]|uniref:outer membrane beta-barrel protein n=1 Tax=Tenacibaculum halocynthiae TaxID=1254437 RepID=UPI003893771A
MKKIIIAAIFIASGILNAQENKGVTKIEKGTWNFTTDLSVYSFNRSYDQIKNENSTFSFNITPKLNYFIGDNLSLGFGIGYNYRNNDNTDNNQNLTTQNTNTFSFNSYIKKHYFIVSNLSFFLQGEVNYQTGKTKTIFQNSSNIPTSDINTFFIGIRPGVSYFLTNKIAIQAYFGSLGYTNTTIKNGTSFKENQNRFDLNLNSSQLIFGMSYYW